jgi:hypothetical protein
VYTKYFHPLLLGLTEIEKRKPKEQLMFLNSWRFSEIYNKSARKISLRLFKAIFLPMKTLIIFF